MFLIGLCFFYRLETSAPGLSGYYWYTYIFINMIIVYEHSAYTSIRSHQLATRYHIQRFFQEMPCLAVETHRFTLRHSLGCEDCPSRGQGLPEGVKNSHGFGGVVSQWFFFFFLDPSKSTFRDSQSLP